MTFEQVFSLYILDKNLRVAVMAAMLDLEEYIKEAVADVVAKSFGIDQFNYLQYRNYQNKKKYKRRFTLTGILETLTSTLETDKEPIHHYKSKYGIVPPWILFKSVYFSTIINFIDQLKIAEQRMMVNKLYSNIKDISEENQVKLMMDTLFISLEYRNIAAHGGRIYNYKPKRDLHFDNNDKFTTEGFCKLLRLLNTINYYGPYRYLDDVLNRELNRHCNAFPQDITYLSQILNINISSHQVVWITDKSNKYHDHRFCSGLKNAKEMDLEKAIKLGYTKCKKCCQT
ncbi:Abi family protein [Clostridium sp. AM58-1XD]|nr:Abi family protein [Clostridium sp. AM58-1XD]